VNLDQWDWEVPEGTPVAVSSMGGPEGLWSGNQPQFPDIGGCGNHEFGNRVGILLPVSAPPSVGRIEGARKALSGWRLRLC
jgi:hypothetical protein